MPKILPIDSSEVTQFHSPLQQVVDNEELDINQIIGLEILDDESENDENLEENGLNSIDGNNQSFEDEETNYLSNKDIKNSLASHEISSQSDFLSEDEDFEFFNSKHSSPVPQNLASLCFLDDEESFQINYSPSPKIFKNLSISMKKLLISQNSSEDEQSDFENEEF